MHVEQACRRIGGEHGTHVALDRVLRVSGPAFFPAGEGIEPRRVQRRRQPRGFAGNPAIDDGGFRKQEPVTCLAPVYLSGRACRAACESRRLLDGQQTVECERGFGLFDSSLSRRSRRTSIATSRLHRGWQIDATTIGSRKEGIVGRLQRYRGSQAGRARFAAPGVPWDAIAIGC